MQNSAPRVVLAPMAGITDRPFRILCRRFGAEATTSEMVSSNPALRNTNKSQLRLDRDGEVGPQIVQIAGAEPQIMADAARYNVDQGADVIDINMGCPAKKVCQVMAGSALLGNEKLVGQILESVVNAVDVPVTVKIRTGTDPENRNGLEIAKIAEQSGIRSLVVHGRTRACAYRGEAEYETIRLIKKAVSIPVFANGDINSPQKAKQVLDFTGADGVMIGRAAQGSPWIFDQIRQFLSLEDNLGSEVVPGIIQPKLSEIEVVMFEHLHSLYDFYGEFQGVRVARKHIRWYLEKLPQAEILRGKWIVDPLLQDKHTWQGKKFWQQISRVDNIETQLRLLADFFESLIITTKVA